MKSNISHKPLILNPKDGISDIIYQIKSNIKKQSSILVYIPDEMYMLYNPVNRGLFVHTIKQLIGEYTIELFSSDIKLVSLLQSHAIIVKTSHEMPQIEGDTISDEIDPYINFFGYQESHSNNTVPPSSDTEILFQSEPAKPQVFSKPKSDTFAWGLLFWIVFSVTLFLGGLAVILIPRADITIKTTLEELSKDFEVTFDPNITDISVENRVIPSITDTISASVEGTYEATGSQSGGTKAGGSITIINNTSASQQLVSNTRFRSEKGRQFRLVDAVTVPAKGSVEGKIIADAIGLEYNIPVGKLTIPGFEDNPTKLAAIYGELKTAINNGATENGAVVTDEDISKARIDLQKKLTEVVNTQINERNDSRALSIQSKINEIDFIGLPKEGDRLRSFTVKATGNLMGVFYQEEDLDTLMRSLLSTQVLESKELGNDIEINFDAPQDFPNKQAVKARVYVKYTIRPKFDEQKIKENVRLRKISYAQKYLQELGNTDSIDIKLLPKFSPIIPLLTSRINISIQ